MENVSLEDGRMSKAKDNDLEIGGVAKAKQDEGISFFDLFTVLWRRKIMIIAITVFAMVGVVVFSIISLKLPSETSPLPNVYTSRAYMLITEGRLPAADHRETLLGYGFRRGPSYADLALFLLRSNALLDSVIYDVTLSRYGYNGLHTVLTRGMLRSGLGPRHNENSGVLSVSFTHIDPVFARDVVNLTVARLENRFVEIGLERSRTEQKALELHLTEVFQNILLLDEERRRLEQSVAFIPLTGGSVPAIMADISRATMESEAMRQVYAQLRVQHEMLRANMAAETTMLQILELAEVPYERSGPSRARLCIIVSLVAVFFSVLLAFALETISNIRKDPVAMAKLRRRDA